MRGDSLLIDTESCGSHTFYPISNITKASVLTASKWIAVYPYVTRDSIICDFPALETGDRVETIRIELSTESLRSSAIASLPLEMTERRFWLPTTVQERGSRGETKDSFCVAPTGKAVALA